MKRLIYFLMALVGFGFTGCEDSPFAQEDAYGCPYVTFRMTARVVDSDGRPIEGISVGFSDVGTCAYSDADGGVDIVKTIGRVPKEVAFIDKDGAENGGEYDILRLDISEMVERTGEPSGAWHNGDYEAELGDVVMTLKDDSQDSNE